MTLRPGKRPRFLLNGSLLLLSWADLLVLDVDVQLDLRVGFQLRKSQHWVLESVASSTRIYTQALNARFSLEWVFKVLVRLLGIEREDTGNVGSGESIRSSIRSKLSWIICIWPATNSTLACLPFHRFQIALIVHNSISACWLFCLRIIRSWFEESAIGEYCGNLGILAVRYW